MLGINGLLFMLENVLSTKASILHAGSQIANVFDRILLVFGYLEKVGILERNLCRHTMSEL